MKKQLFMAVLLGLSYVQIKAQDLREYIPHNALSVGSINGKEVLRSVSVQELNASKLGQKLLGSLSKETGHEIGSLDEIGLDLNGNSYFYYQKNDSLSYSVTLLPLKDASKLQQLVGTQDYVIKEKGSYWVGVPKYSSPSEFVAWDDRKVLLVKGFYNDLYFNDFDFTEIEAELSAIKELQGTVDSPESPYSDQMVEEAVQIGTVQEAVQIAEIGAYEIPYFQDYTLQNYVNAYFEFCEKLKEAANNDRVAVLDSLQKNSYVVEYLAREVDSIYAPDSLRLNEFMDNKAPFVKETFVNFKKSTNRDLAHKMLDDITFYGSDFNVVPDPYAYTYDYKSYYDEKKFLESKWTEQTITTLMRPAVRSIATNEKYMAQLDQKAVGNFWNNNLGEMFLGLYNGMGSLINPYSNGMENLLLGYGQLSSHLYLGAKEGRISVDMELSDEFANGYRKIMDQKINQDFFKYVNEDRFLGYMTYSMNTKNMLEEYPKLMAKSYGSLFGANKEELELGLELFSFLLDEGAVAEMAPGDAMFILSGLNSHEVTYTEYEYDGDYNSTPVERTKTEKTPDFLFMASTKENPFTKKLIAYLLAKEALIFENGYYSLDTKDRSLPLQLHFIIKDDIFFLGTSPEEIASINNGSYKAKLSKKHRNAITQGNFAAYFNGKKFGKEFPLEGIDLPSLENARYAMENAANFTITSSKIKNNHLQSAIVMEIPEDHRNAASYILEFIDRFGY